MRPLLELIHVVHRSFRLMAYRLGLLQVVWSINPGSEGMTDHSTGGLMLQDMPKSGEFIRHSMGACSFHPPDGTALVRQFKFPATWRLETSQLGPTITGPTKSKDRRGLKSHGKVQGPHRRGREFPEPLTGASLRSRRELCIRQCK